MAAGKAKPITSDLTGRDRKSSESGAGRSFDFDLGIDPAYLGRLARPQPWRLRHLMYLIAAMAVLFWVGMFIAQSAVLAVLMVLGCVILLFISMMGMGVILAWRATTRQDTLLQILAIAAEGEMPLAPAVAAFADQYGGFSRRRMLNLAARLNGGTPLAESLEISRGLATRDAVLLAWVGEAAGLLPKALRIAATSRTSQLPIWTGIASRLSYVLFLLLAMQSVSGFVLYFIVPKLEAIARDFDLSLPWVTIAVIHTSQFLTRYGALAFFVPVIEVCLLIFLPFSFLGWGSYSVPGIDRLLGRRHTALVLRSLSLMLEAGKPVSLGLSTLARHYPAFWVRRRLAGAESDIRQGVDWIQALWRRH